MLDHMAAFMASRDDNRLRDRMCQFGYMALVVVVAGVVLAYCVTGVLQRVGGGATSGDRLVQAPSLQQPNCHQAYERAVRSDCTTERIQEFDVAVGQPQRHVNTVTACKARLCGPGLTDDDRIRAYMSCRYGTGHAHIKCRPIP